MSIMVLHLVDIKPGVFNVLMWMKIFSGHVFHWDVIESDSLSYDIINLHYFSLPTQVMFALDIFKSRQGYYIFLQNMHR